MKCWPTLLAAVSLLRATIYLQAQQSTQSSTGNTPHPAGSTPNKKSSLASKKETSSANKGKNSLQAPGKSSSKFFESSITLPAIPRMNIAQIIATLGKPDPFLLAPSADNRSILIYCVAMSKLSACDAELLQKLETDIEALALGPDATEEISVDHASSLGDVVSKAQSLNYKGLTIQAVGADKIRITRTGAVSPQEYEEFKNDLKRLSWQVQPESPAARVFYINASDASNALGGSQATLKTGGKPSGTAGSPPTVTIEATATQTTNFAPCPTPAANAPKAAASDTPADNKATSQSNCSPTATDTSAKKSTTAAATSPNSDTSKPAVSVSTLSPDVLLFSDKNAGDDEGISERKRMLALIDFPRPEVIINTFSFQTSASDPKVLADGSILLQRAIGNYNDAIQAALFRAWLYLQDSIQDKSFFDKSFYDYLTKRFVAEPAQDGNKLELWVDTGKRDQFDMCEAGTYCLGYTSLFHPIRPSLTDMLLAVVASNRPAYQFRAAIERMEGFKYQNGSPYQSTKDRSGNTEPSAKTKHADEGKCETAASCEVRLDWASMSCDQRDISTWRKADKLSNIVLLRSTGKPYAQTDASAQTQDSAEKIQANEARQIMTEGFRGSPTNPHIFPMYCFREAIESAFPVAESYGYNQENLAKPLRAALANFLFQYKMSQQYPHEFSGYELSQSAQELNSELNPLIVAFNRDLSAALNPIQDVAQCDAKKNGWWGWASHGTRFINNGIISVRTVSGKETIVDTETQNYFDAANPPSITDVISSVGQADSAIPKVLKTNLTANEAAVIIGALNSVKPATSQVGRQFKIDITPRSLSGASSAELDVSLTTGETAAPSLYSNGKMSSDNLSRVAKNNTTTKVRLESIKLFEISSFTAVIQRSRHNFPLLPPFVEIPYIGSILSVPVPGAKEYHRSTAIMSAVVVPTAADLASGVVFTRDRVLLADEHSSKGNDICLPATGGALHSCYATRALSFSDLYGAAISEFNKKMIRCFSGPDSLVGPCNAIRFDSLLRGQ